MSSRIASWIAERADLFNANIGEPGFFKELAGGGVFERLVFVDEPAWKGPQSFEWIMSAFDQQNSQPPIRRIEENNIDSQRRSRMIVAVLF